MISCPNCGKLLEPKEGSAQDRWIVRCPRCGNVPLLEDSQVITISGGEMGGPGLRNLQEKDKELLIHAGVAAEKGKTDDLAGEAEEQVVMGQNVSRNPDMIAAPVPNTRRQEATVEELSDPIEWQEQNKMAVAGKGGKMPLSDPRKRAIAPPIGSHNRPPRPFEKGILPAETDRRKKTTRTIQRSGRRVYPAYYTWLFYGVPGVLLVALVLLTVYQVFWRKDAAPQTTGSPQEIWNKAEEAQQRAYVYYKESLEIRDMQLRLLKLQQSADLYQESMKQGQLAWNAQIRFLMEANKINEQEALQYAQAQYGGYPEKMQRWEQSFYLIQDKIKKIKEKNK